MQLFRKEFLNKLQELCFQNLWLHGLLISDYIQKMINWTTNGLDLTMIIMSKMLDLSLIEIHVDLGGNRFAQMRCIPDTYERWTFLSCMSKTRI